MKDLVLRITALMAVMMIALSAVAKLPMLTAKLLTRMASQCHLSTL